MRARGDLAGLAGADTEGADVAGADVEGATATASAADCICPVLRRQYAIAIAVLCCAALTARFIHAVPCQRADVTIRPIDMIGYTLTLNRRGTVQITASAVRRFCQARGLAQGNHI
jgi:hypothetical protein